MKKILIYVFSFLYSSFCFSQNSIESNPTGTTAVHKVVGVGSSLTNNFKVSSYVSTGSGSTPNNLIANYGVASNSTDTNVGVYGQAMV